MDKKSLGINPVIILLIIASFAIGYLFSRVKNLEQAVSPQQAQEVLGGDGQVAGEEYIEPEAGEVDPVTKDDHIRGDLSKAKVALIEYSDYECPFCSRFHETMIGAMDELGEEFVWVYRHFPLDQLHAKARDEAYAAECVAELGGNDKFWSFSDLIYKTTKGNDDLDLDTLPDLASQVGVDKTKFSECYESGKYKDKVEEHYQSGLKAGVNGTPGNILLNIETGVTKLIPGAVPLESIKSAIEEIIGS